MTVEDLSEAMRRRRDWRDLLARTEAGTPRKNLFNACVALREHPDLTGKLAHNEFVGSTFVRGAVPWDARPNRAWSAHDDLAATEWLQSAAVGILVGSAVAREAVERVAYENPFHPVLNYLERLKWDGTGRLRPPLRRCAASGRVRRHYG